MSAVLALMLTLQPGRAGLLFALPLGLLMALVAIAQPRLAIVLVIWLLPLLALARRVLIPVFGLTSYDPLLLMAPGIAILLLLRLFVLDKRSLLASRLSKLMLLLVVVTVAEALNPLNQSVIAGIVGLLFLAAPLFWFFIGRELANTKLLETVLVGLVVIGTAIALYGVWQTSFGLPSWDAKWVELNGYTALNVGGTIRSFGTFSSSAEYAYYLGTALIAAIVLVLYRRVAAVLAIPILTYAIILASGRSVVVLTALAVAVVVGLRTGDGRLAIASIIVGMAGWIAALYFLGPGILVASQDSGNALVSHQFSGLLNPFDSQSSTLPAHIAQIVSGITTGFAHPLGLGTAINTLAGARLNGLSGGTEFDLSNEFSSLGIVGGLAFLAVIAVGLRGVIRLSMVNPGLVAMTAAGVLIVTFGQWVNGGFYALSPLIWLVIGWSDRAQAEVPPLTSETNRQPIEDLTVLGGSSPGRQ